MNQRGFTLVEVLFAMVILTVALVGVALTVAVQSGGMAASFPTGQAAVSRGYYVSRATALAQERLEEVKRIPYDTIINNQVTNDQFGLDPIPAAGNCCPDDTPLVGFIRQVRVQTGAPGANMKTVTVTVTFNLPKETGIGQESIAISTVIAARP